jgi:flavin reductase (DIM6/NTAB) family NADH-FMN oxidoreductase RutF
MSRLQIPFHELNLNILRAWDRGWYLLTAGDFATGDFNTMTVSWGALGWLWNKPFAQVVVRPQRFTYSFMEQYPSFTLSAFSEAYRPALNLLGSKSGREGDKIAESGLTPQASNVVAAPGFTEAELVLECEKIYYDDLAPEHFLAKFIAPNYRQDFHRVYYGEIKAIYGLDKYRVS